MRLENDCGYIKPASGGPDIVVGDLFAVGGGCLEAA
jgi:hypothetical protein